MALVSVSAALAAGNNVFVYRNDGHFNAFLREEIDSMRYSSIGVDNIEYGNAVTQEIFTADSVYRIPLNAIDSISVFQPETIYKPDVRVMNTDFRQYIRAVNGMTLSIDRTIPESLCPVKNDVIICTEFTDMFPDGFAGRVNSISKGNELTVSCDSVGLDAIYSQLVTIGDYILSPDTRQQGRYMLRKADDNESDGEIPMNITYPGIQIGNDKIGVSINGSTGYRFRFIARISDKSPYVEFRVQESTKFTVTGKGSAGKHSESDTQHGPSFTALKAPIPGVPGIFVALRLMPFLKWEISGDFDLECSVSVSETNTFVYENNKCYWRGSPREFTPTVEPGISINGSIWGGVNARIEVTTFANLLSLGRNTYIGPKVSGNIPFNFGDMTDDASIYDLLRDAKISACLCSGNDYSFNIRTGLKSEHAFTLAPSVTMPMVEYGDLSLYLFPSFDQLEVTTSGNSVSVGSKCRRNTISPWEIGINISNDNGYNLSKFNESSYWIERNSKGDMLHEFDNLNLNTEYRVRPVIRWNNLEIPARPLKNITLGTTVETGTSSANQSNAIILGRFYFDDENTSVIEPSKVGFCYSDISRSPMADSDKTALGTMLSNSQFTATIDGLKEATTYYYRAFIVIGNQYIYGDTKCFTTTGNEDDEDDDPGNGETPPNKGGDDEEGTPPEAKTIGHDKVSTHSANITLEYSNVSPETSCGYFLTGERASSNGSNPSLKTSDIMVNLDAVSGKKTITLTNLEPGTVYYYQAFARNEYGKSLGDELCFETEKEEVPTASVLDVKEKKLQSAIVSYKFENLPDNAKCGLEITSQDWSYNLSVPAEEGASDFLLENLLPETTYTVAATVEYSDEPVYSNEFTFETKAPDMTGWWVFNDAMSYPPRLHRVYFYADGTTNQFYGINRLEWEREGNYIKIIWRTLPSETPGVIQPWVEYRGYFNEDFTQAEGECAHCSYPLHQYYEYLSDYPFFIKRYEWYDPDVEGGGDGEMGPP